MKDLLITHVDLDGISPIILMNLTKHPFDYKMIEISEVQETFTELLASDLSIYQNIFITDLTLTQEIYEEITKKDVNILVFDHHETHMFANTYPFVTVKVHENNRPTCGTELFYYYIKEKYPSLNTSLIANYVDLVRQADTWDFTDGNKAKHLVMIMENFGKANFIKSITKRLQKEKKNFELTAFEKRFVKLKQEELERYMEKKERTMMKYNIKGRICGIVFAENNKSELGNYLSVHHPELDLIILIDASSRISYRTAREDISVSEFASFFGGGGHQKASGSKFNEEDRQNIIYNYYKEVTPIEE